MQLQFYFMSVINFSENIGNKIKEVNIAAKRGSSPTTEQGTSESKYIDQLSCC